MPFFGTPRHPNPPNTFCPFFMPFLAVTGIFWTSFPLFPDAVQQKWVSLGLWFLSLVLDLLACLSLFCDAEFKIKVPEHVRIAKG